MAQPASPSSQSLVGMGSTGQSTMVRTDDNGFLMWSPFTNDFIGQGKLFYIYDSAVLAVARTFHLAVGANPVDMKLNVAAGVSTPVTITEGVTTGSGGTPITIQNFNRTSANTINLVATLNKSSVTGGADFFASSAGFGTLTPAASSIQSNMADKSNYWRLKPNTNYLITYTPGASVLTSMNATFYENVP